MIGDVSSSLPARVALGSGAGLTLSVDDRIATIPTFAAATASSSSYKQSSSQGEPCYESSCYSSQASLPRSQPDHSLDTDHLTSPLPSLQQHDASHEQHLLPPMQRYDDSKQHHLLLPPAQQHDTTQQHLLLSLKPSSSWTIPIPTTCNLLVTPSQNDLLSPSNLLKPSQIYPDSHNKPSDFFSTPSQLHPPTRKQNDLPTLSQSLADTPKQNDFLLGLSRAFPPTQNDLRLASSKSYPDTPKQNDSGFGSFVTPATGATPAFNRVDLSDNAPRVYQLTSTPAVADLDRPLITSYVPFAIQTCKHCDAILDPDDNNNYKDNEVSVRNI